MSIATDAAFLLKLKKWDDLKQRIAVESAPLVAAEIILRRELFSEAFPSPKEGTNTEDLLGGFKIKGTYKLDRKLDVAALPAVMAELRKMGTNPDPLVRNVPELDTKAYKALSDVNRAIFDNALTTKPASPTLEIVPPKEK